MVVGWLLPPSVSGTRMLPFVAAIARGAEARDLIVFWVESGRDEEAKPIDLSTPDDLPSELSTLRDAMLRTEGLVIEGRAAAGQPADSTTANSPDDDDSAAPQAFLTVSVVRCPANAWAKTVLAQTQQRDIEQLIVPRVRGARLDSDSTRQLTQVIRDEHCELIQLQCGERGLSETPRVLVAAGPGFAATLAIQRALQFADTTAGQLTAVYVEPDVDDFATQVGDEILKAHLGRALGERASDVRRRVVLGDDVTEQLVDLADDFDLIVLGIRHHGWVSRWLREGVSEGVLKQIDATSVAVVRLPTPMTSRLLRAVDQLFRNTVPQLPRDRRVALVQRIQSSSQWDFDFVALICLSTLIATCGLLQSSAPVVIGAMLVAPLMTPLLAAGMSLVQGNPILLRNAMLSVLRGFLLALGLAYGIGWLVLVVGSTEDPAALVTSEIASRGHPRFLDLMVALVSGIAAAYANGRPNLLSALPGVAIASALVPPIASLGLSAAWRQWDLTLGAGLLFLTNIVAIVLGTAYAFWAVGVRGADRKGILRSPTWRWFVALTLALIGLGVIESLPARRIPADMRARAVTFFDQYPELQLADIQWRTPRANEVIIRINSAQPLPATLLRELAAHVNQDRAVPVRVQIQTQLVTVVPP